MTTTPQPHDQTINLIDADDDDELAAELHAIFAAHSRVPVSPDAELLIFGTVVRDECPDAPASPLRSALKDLAAELRKV